MLMANAKTATQSTRIALALALITGVLVCSPAAAQEARSRDGNYFAPKLLLGLGGEGEVEVGAFDGEGDLEVSYGVGLSYVVPIMRYFAIGGQLGMRWWISDAASDNDGDRNLLFDLVALPQGRLPITDDVELYLSVPIGLAYDIAGDDGFAIGAAGAQAQAEVNNAFGFTVGALIGARFGLGDSLGLLAELGYQMHAFSHEIEGTAGIPGFMTNTSTDADIDIGQFQLNLGVFFD